MAAEVSAHHRIAARLLILTLASLGCGDSVDPGSTLRLVPDHVAIDPGETLTLRLQREEGAPDGTPVWESWDPEIASVTQEGIVTGLASGFATIVAQVGDEAAGAQVAVIGPLEGVVLTMRQERMEVGSAVTASAVPFDTGGTGVSIVEIWRPDIQFPDTPFEWASSNPGVATVTPVDAQNATVTAQGPGTAVISVTFGGVTDTAEVVVGADSLVFVEDTLHVEVDRAVSFHLVRKGFPTSTVPRDSVTLTFGDPSIAELLQPATRWVLVGRQERTTTLTATYKGFTATTVVIVAGLPERFVSIASIFGHACGTYDDGRLYCWDDATSGIPVRVESPALLAAIWGRFGHMCGLDFDGDAWCWGGNTWGQLGTGAMEDRATPTAVAGGITFTELAVADDHSCGIATDGAAYCWGRNEHGQIGIGAAGAAVLVPTPVASEEKFISIAAGGTHTCAVTAGAAAWCWGAGDGLRNMGLPTVACAPANVGLFCTPAPSRVQAVLGFSQIAAAGGRTCAVMTDGSGYCWGQIFGAPDPVGPNRIPAQVPLVEVALTRNNHLCGIAAGGSVYCWYQFVPHLVAGVIPFESLAGGEMICGIGSDGAYCGEQNFVGRIEELNRVAGQP